MTLEARCTKCGEIFIPNDEEDLEHGETEMGEPCGGPGEIVGEWWPTRAPLPACDQASATNEHGECVHCGAPRPDLVGVALLVLGPEPLAAILEACRTAGIHVITAAEHSDPAVLFPPDDERQADEALDAWAADVAERIIANGGYVPPDVPPSPRYAAESGAHLFKAGSADPNTMERRAAIDPYRTGWYTCSTCGYTTSDPLTLAVVNEQTEQCPACGAAARAEDFGAER